MIYGNLFFYEDSRGIKYNVWSYEQCNSFLCLFPSWQVEELSYVNDFVTDKILEKWQELEEDGYNALIAADPLTWDFDKPPYQSRWKFDFFSTYEKQRWQRSYHQYFATLTLPTLLPLFKAKGDQLLQVVKDNCDGKWPHDFLSFALDEDPSWSPLIETMKDEHEQRVSTGVKIQFRRDSVGEANKAWLWAHGYQPCDLYIEPSNENPIGARLRRFGYVFWDSTRLYDTVTLK